MSSFLTLEFVALSLPFGRSLASDLSLEVWCDIVGVVGRNGAGESTLLRKILNKASLENGTIS